MPVPAHVWSFNWNDDVVSHFGEYLITTCRTDIGFPSLIGLDESNLCDKSGVRVLKLSLIVRIAIHDNKIRYFRVRVFTSCDLRLGSRN